MQELGLSFKGLSGSSRRGTAFLFYSGVRLMGIIAQGRHRYIHTTVLLSTPTFHYSDNLRKSTEKRFLLCRGFSLWSLSPAVWACGSGEHHGGSTRLGKPVQLTHGNWKARKEHSRACVSIPLPIPSIPPIPPSPHPPHPPPSHPRQ